MTLPRRGNPRHVGAALAIAIAEATLGFQRFGVAWMKSMKSPLLGWTQEQWDDAIDNAVGRMMRQQERVDHLRGVR